jgi:WhiB family redox-sensing transcriptional regulator
MTVVHPESRNIIEGDLPTFHVPDWMQNGACVTIGGDMWFPESTPHKAAFQICNTCPVQPLCLDYAITTNQRHGIWGGTTEADRERMRKQVAAA